ncbi:hypothetical protein GGS21DRAFT_494546 [Xylaria nigripes]|nr:hypothetical protein GGS21DRAFT_494546 [Xylaria nigripes]
MTTSSSSNSGHGEHQDVRLELDDFSVRTQASKLVRTGAAFNNVPILQSSGSNWTLFNCKLRDAALSEGVKKILTGEFVKPDPPEDEDNLTTAQWNKYVERTTYWEVMNDHLLGGIMGKLEQAIRQEPDIDEEPSAYIVYTKLIEYCKQRGANHILELTFHLTRKTLPQMRGIDEYNSHWVDTCQAIDSLQLSWKIPDELKQLWYLSNLGEAFEVWKTSMATTYAIADVGNGTPISLQQLMALARDHWAKLASSKRNIQAASYSTK